MQWAHLQNLVGLRCSRRPYPSRSTFAQARTVIARIIKSVALLASFIQDRLRTRPLEGDGLHPPYPSETAGSEAQEKSSRSRGRTGSPPPAVRALINRRGFYLLILAVNMVHAAKVLDQTKPLTRESVRPWSTHTDDNPPSLAPDGPLHRADPFRAQYGAAE